MASSVRSLPGKLALLWQPPSTTLPPTFVRFILPRLSSCPLISEGSTTAPRRILPVARWRWRDPSTISQPLLEEFLEEHGDDNGKGLPLSASAAESVAAAHPALANAHVQQLKFRCYNFELPVWEEESPGHLCTRIWTEAKKLGITKEVRRRQFFEKKPAKKKRKAKEAARKRYFKPLDYVPHFLLADPGNRGQDGEERHRKRRRRSKVSDLDDDDDDDENNNWEYYDV